MRHVRSIFLAVALAVAVAAPALAADFSYKRGETVALGFRSVPFGYTIEWYSDIDGFLMRGSTLRTSSLSVGTHEISYLFYWNATGEAVYEGSVEVEIIDPAPRTPSSSSSGVSSSTSGVVTPGEFEPVSELLLGTPDAYSVEDLYPKVLDALRGVVKTRIYVDNRYVEYELEDLFARWGVDDTDYTIVRTPIDSIWMRDYGPLFTKRNGRLEIVDIHYYDERPNDDVIPQFIAREKGITARRLDYYWEGGNFTADGRGNLFTSDVFYSRNWDSQSRMNANTTAVLGGQLHVFDHMRNDGGTGHIDMFMLMTGPRSFFLNKFNAGHQNARRMDDHASRLQSMGYSVTRLALADTAFSSYTNGVLVNGVALVPTYGRSTTDQAALAAYRAAGYSAVGIDCRRIIQWSGAIHCVTMTVPR